MRITIVTETYFPQVNGVSRTLGELVRHLTECGDSVQLIHPDYGEAIEGHGQAHAVRSVSAPVLQGAVPAPAAVPGRPPGDRRLPARPGPHRHRGDAGPERPPLRPEAPAQDRLELPHQLRPVQPPLPGRLGPRRDRALPAMVPQPHPGDLRPVAGDDPRARGPRASSGWCSGSGAWTRRLFRPDRPGRHGGPPGAGLVARGRGHRLREPDRAGEERGLPRRRPVDRGRPAARCPDPHGRRRPVARGPRAPARPVRPVRRLPQRARTSPTITPPPTSSRSPA